MYIFLSINYQFEKRRNRKKNCSRLCRCCRCITQKAKWVQVFFSLSSIHWNKTVQIILLCAFFSLVLRQKYVLLRTGCVLSRQASQMPEKIDFITVTYRNRSRFKRRKKMFQIDYGKKGTPKYFFLQNSKSFFREIYVEIVKLFTFKKYYDKKRKKMLEIHQRKNIFKKSHTCLIQFKFKKNWIKFLERIRELFGLFDHSSQRSIEYWHWWSVERVEEVSILHLLAAWHKCNGIGIAGAENTFVARACVSVSARVCVCVCVGMPFGCVCVMLRSAMFHICIAFCWGIRFDFFNCCCSFTSSFSVLPSRSAVRWRRLCPRLDRLVAVAVVSEFFSEQLCTATECFSRIQSAASRLRVWRSKEMDIVCLAVCSSIASYQLLFHINRYKNSFHRVYIYI